MADRALFKIEKVGQYSDLCFLKDFLLKENAGRYLKGFLLETVASRFSKSNEISFLLDLKINLSAGEEAYLLKSAADHETQKILSTDPPYAIFKALLPLTNIGQKAIKIAQAENKEKSHDVIISFVLDAYLRSKVKHETELTNKINQHGRHNER